ncbi:AraC family transcriptional regulator [Steroidobacter flavus]|uniref:AraC family transcriptional regulator n=2 Tax=Steroidobacter flavus TaxID=1842136 RepID=A0ABV8SL56_9GAMM
MDALAAVVTLLKPQTILSKVVRGGGRWGIRYPAFGQPSFALVIAGPCWLTAEKARPTKLETGDFILFPATPGFALASDLQVKPKLLKIPTEHVDEIVHGDVSVAPSVTLLGGYFAFDPINASMLVDLLPPMLHIQASAPASRNVAPIVELIKREASDKRPGQALVLTRLIEIMLVEALRSAPSEPKSGGLLAGLRDTQLAIALRGIHMKASHPWTLDSLARQAGMSRSSFADRFARIIGTTPLNYLLQWRIAVAKNLLAHEQMSVAETALAVGYQSASAFSTAFSRETGTSPKEFVAAVPGGRSEPR